MLQNEVRFPMNELGLSNELDGDDLKICWNKKGAERPKEFASKADTKVRLVVLDKE